MKKFKQNLGAMLIVGSLIVACSNGFSEFKPSNEMEKQAYDFLKEKYPNIKIVSYDSVYDFYRKDKNNNKDWIEGLRDIDKFEMQYGSNDYFYGTLYATTNDGKKLIIFNVHCIKNKKCNEEINKTISL